jgi:chemotaxis protein CheX
MSDCTSVNEEVLDAVGEVANMVIGNFKTMIEEHLGPLGLSIPTVIYGRNFTSRSLGTNSWIVVPFRCEDEAMTIRCCLAPAKEPLNVRSGYTHASTVLA